MFIRTPTTYQDRLPAKNLNFFPFFLSYFQVRQICQMRTGRRHLAGSRMDMCGGPAITGHPDHVIPATYSLLDMMHSALNQVSTSACRVTHHQLTVRLTLRMFSSRNDKYLRTRCPSAVYLPPDLRVLLPSLSLATSCDGLVGLDDDARTLAAAFHVVYNLNCG